MKPLLFQMMADFQNKSKEIVADSESNALEELINMCDHFQREIGACRRFLELSKQNFWNSYVSQNKVLGK